MDFPLQLMSTDITDVAQLAGFIRGVDGTQIITELVILVSNDIFDKLDLEKVKSSLFLESN